jgi:hypothetical protein
MSPEFPEVDNTLLNSFLAKYEKRRLALEDFIDNTDLVSMLLLNGYLPVSVVQEHEHMYSGISMGGNIKDSVNKALSSYQLLDYTTIPYVNSDGEYRKVSEGHFTNFFYTAFYYLVHTYRNEHWEDSKFVFKTNSDELKVKLGPVVKKLTSLVKSYNNARKKYIAVFELTYRGNREKMYHVLDQVWRDLSEKGGKTIVSSKSNYSADVIKINRDHDITKFSIETPSLGSKAATLSFTSDCDFLKKYFDTDSKCLELKELVRRDGVFLTEVKKAHLVQKLANNLVNPAPF